MASLVDTQSRDQLEAFALRWAGFWNSGDVESVLQHFHSEIVFTSPTALEVVGSATVRGKDALRAYWTAALQRVGKLHFTVDRILWDPATRELAIIYTSVVQSRSRPMSENLKLDAAGLVVSAQVFHGVMPA